MSNSNQGYTVFRTMKVFFKEFQKSFHKMSMNDHLTAPQAMVIGNLIHKGPMKVSDLSKAVMLSNSTVSGIIDRLEKQSIVMRNRSTEDRRVVLIDITPEFRETAHQKFRAQEEHFAEIFKQASPEEAEKILTGFKTFNKVMRRHRNQTQGLEE